MSSTASGPSNSSRYLDFDEYVDLKLQKTRSSIKTTDILVALAGVATMFLGYLLVFVVCDQWVVPGGFGIALRWLLLSTLLISTAAWLTWKVGLPYLRTVNRLFAAREIEKADPDLKSNLLNLVDLRAAGRPVDPAILRALEKNAAVGLQNVDVAQAIDHRPLMRISYALLAVVVLFCLYALFSPKKISNSILRGLLPATQLGVATRTEIINVQPGDQTVLARKTVSVFADIAGDVPEKVWLHYTTADGKFRDEPVELRTDSDGPTRFKGSLPAVMQDLTYVVRAGDAESRLYRITVNQPPSATVTQVRYQFPPYMKLEATEQAGGQIESWEGTKVHITAHTNIPVKSAKVQFIDIAEAGPNGDQVDLSISGNGRELTGSLTLGFRSDGNYSKLYQIYVETESGATDPKPIQYGLTIRPDLPPEISILEPTTDLEVPANAMIPLLIEARDPDFELSHINLHIRKNGQPIHKEPLSDGHQQRLLLKHDLRLERLGDLKTGDVLELWAQAFDNKQPRPNVKITPELKLKIVDRIPDKQAQQKFSDDKAHRDQRLKDAEQQQNPDQQPEQKATQDAGTDHPREPQEPKGREQDPMPAPKPDQTEQKPGEKGQTGTKGGAKPQQAPDKAGIQNQQQPGEEGAQKDQPLNSDGVDDQKALERLIEALNTAKNKPADQTPPQEGSANENQSDKGDSKNSKEGSEPQPNGNSSEDKPNKTGSDDKSPKKPNSQNSSERDPKKPPEGTERPKPNEGMPPDTDNSNPMPGDQNKPKPDKNAGPKGTSPNNSSPDKATDSPMEKGSGSDPMPGPEEKNNNATKPGEKPDPTKPEEGKGPSDNPSGEQPQQNPGGGEKPAQGPKGEGAQGEGNNSESKPPMNNGKGPEKKGPGAEGPEEQAPESPNAQRKQADGSETGTAKADRDPKGDATRSDNPDLKRDPKENPETRPGNAKKNDSNDPAQKNADSQVKNPKPTGEGTERQKIDRQNDNRETSPPGNNKQSRQGDPNAANEPKKGEGNKEQRSKTGSGGEGGTSKEDKEGDPGSKNSGEGDATNRPGEQQSSDNKTQGDPKGGTGRDAKGGEKKQGDKGSGDGANKQGSKGNGSDSKGSDKSEGGEQKSSEAGQQGSGEQPGKPGEGSGQGDSKGPAGKPGKGTNSGKAGAGTSGKQGNAPGNGEPDGKNEPVSPSEGPNSTPEGEAANLEFKKQATELVLKRLQDGLERGDIDPELLAKLGWTEDEMRRFSERLAKHLQDANSADETPESLARRQQFEEMLKSLDVRKKGTVRSGENSPQREVNQIESGRRSVPKEYRSAFDKFNREVTRQKTKPAPAQK